MLLDDFQWHDKNYIWLMLALIPLWMLCRHWLSSARQKLQQFAGKSKFLQYKKILPRNSLDTPTKFCLLGVLFLILALARPQADPVVEEREGQALDIMVLLDVSKSMAAEDAYPNRLQKAKRSIGTLLNQLNGDRVGIVAFAGSAVLISPLTTDYEIIRNFLFALSIDTIENQGTNIEAAIQVTMDAFQRGSEHEVGHGDRSHVMLLYSDGEMTAGETDGAMKEMKKQNLLLYTVALGTEKGVPIPIRNKNGELISYKRDRAGNSVLSAADFKNLANLASLAGGKAYRSSLDDTEAAAIAGELANLHRSGTKTMKSRIYTEFYYIPLLIGFILLILGYLPLQQIFGASLAALFCLSLLAPSALAQEEKTPATEETPGFFRKLQSLFESKERQQSRTAIEKFQKGKYDEASEKFKEMQVDNPNSAEIAYNTGTALLKEGKTEQGRSLLNEVSKIQNKSETGKDSTNFLSAYNLAGSYAEQKDYAQAIQNYAALVKALSEKSNRTPLEEKLLEQAKKNLEFSTKEQEQQQQKQQKDQKEEEKDKNDDKKQEKGSDNKSESKESKSDKQESKEQDQKENDKNEKNQDNKQQQSQQNYDFKHKKKFKENEVLSEQDAKRILEALKQQEQLLQKKFLQQKTISRQSADSNDKDW